MKRVLALAAFALMMSPAHAKSHQAGAVTITVPTSTPTLADTPVAPSQAPAIGEQTDLTHALVSGSHPSVEAPAPQPEISQEELDAAFTAAFNVAPSQPLIEEVDDEGNVVDQYRQDEDDAVIIVTTPAEDVVVVAETPQQTPTQVTTPDFSQFKWRSNRTLRALIANVLGYKSHTYRNQYGHTLTIGAFPRNVDEWNMQWRKAGPVEKASVAQLMNALSEYKHSEKEKFENEEGKINRHDIEPVALAAFSLPNQLFKYVTNKMDWGMRKFRICNKRQAEYAYGYDFEHFEPRFRHAFVKMSRGKQVAIKRLIEAVAAFYNTNFSEYPYSTETVGELGMIQRKLNVHWHPFS